MTETDATTTTTTNNNNNTIEIPDHAAAGRKELAKALEDWVPQDGDSNTEKVRKANKRIKIAETFLTSASSDALAEEHLYRHKIITRVVSNDNREEDGNVASGGEDDENNAPVTKAELKAELKALKTELKTELQEAMRIERFHYYNMTNAHLINSQAGFASLMPIIERGDHAGTTPTTTQLNLPPNATKTHLQNLSAACISTIHNVYKEPSFNEDDVSSLTMRRNNLVMFFFGIGSI